MDNYYVYMDTSKGWMPIKEFRGNQGFAFYDSSEQLSFDEANQRRIELASRHPDYKFIVMSLEYYQSLT